MGIKYVENGQPFRRSPTILKVSKLLPGWLVSLPDGDGQISFRNVGNTTIVSKLHRMVTTNAPQNYQRQVINSGGDASSESRKSWT